jgi:hypothetical protein
MRQVQRCFKGMHSSCKSSSSDSTSQDRPPTCNDRSDADHVLTPAVARLQFALSKAVEAAHVASRKAGSADLLAEEALQNPGLAVCATEAVLQVLAVLCHMWRVQLAAAKHPEAPAAVGQWQQQRPLQPTQLQRQMFNVQLDGIAAAHKDFLEQQLGAAGSSAYIKSMQEAVLLQPPAWLPQFVAGSLSMLVEGPAAALKLEGDGGRKHTHGVMELLTAPAAVALMIEAIQLQHCFLQQQQALEQGQPRNAAATSTLTHQKFLKPAEQLLIMQLSALHRQGKAGGVACPISSWANLPVLQALLLQA